MAVSDTGFISIKNISRPKAVVDVCDRRGKAAKEADEVQHGEAHGVRGQGGAGR